MENNEIDKILKKLCNFSSSSWAIWKEDFEKNLQEKENESTFNFIKGKKETLNKKIIFLGLNKSGKEIKKTYPFTNFHTNKHLGDRKLKEIIQNKKLNNLTGGYMTDLVLDKIESYSNKIKEITKKDFSKLKEQLKILNEKEFNIICFGNKVFDELLKFFKKKNSQLEENWKRHNIREFHVEEDISLNFYRVWHYSNYGIHKGKIEELSNQLTYLNNLMEN